MPLIEFSLGLETFVDCERLCFLEVRSLLELTKLSFFELDITLSPIFINQLKNLVQTCLLNNKIKIQSDLSLSMSSSSKDVALIKIQKVISCSYIYNIRTIFISHEINHKSFKNTSKTAACKVYSSYGSYYTI